MLKNNQKSFKQIQDHLKNVGFVFQGSLIYGGLSNTWDYGPLGINLKNNLQKQWIKNFIKMEINNFLIDSKILMNPQVWKASGHLKNFSDPLIENKVNGKRYRADKIIEEFDPSINAETLTKDEMEAFLVKNILKYENNITKWGAIKDFQLMFTTHQGPTLDSSSQIFLRPETAQGIFVNFKNVQRALRLKIPFGIGQIGKSFRNEITPSHFIFRTREFEQMELEYFCHPYEANEYYYYYLEKCKSFLKNMGLRETSIRIRKHETTELAHYSKDTTDIEFLYPFGWGELLGIANRGDFDLKNHELHSGENLKYLDPITNQSFFPYVIEPSMGVDRLMLAILIDAFHEEEIADKSSRIVLHLDKDLAPYKVAVLPLIKKYHSSFSKKIFQKLISQNLNVTYDENGSIGKRYRRQDAIGTPFVITVTDDSEKTNKVTIRYRDSMLQETICISDIKKFID